MTYQWTACVWFLLDDAHYKGNSFDFIASIAQIRANLAPEAPAWLLRNRLLAVVLRTRTLRENSIYLTKPVMHVSNCVVSGTTSTTVYNTRIKPLESRWSANSWFPYGKCWNVVIMCVSREKVFYGVEHAHVACMSETV